MPKSANNKNMDSLVGAYKDGKHEALDEIIPLVYRQLRQMAQKQLSRAGAKQTLNPTELVHEVFLHMNGSEGLPVSDRAHFFAVAAQCMRWILIDYAKARGREKRGGGAWRISFDENVHAGSPGEASDEIDLSALNDALERLAQQDPRVAKVAELRFLAGMSVEEVATALELSPATVKRDWKLAKAWLSRELKLGEK